MAEQRENGDESSGAGAGDDGTNDIQDRPKRQQQQQQGKQSDDVRDQQIEALIEATALVARLAAMDPERYRQETASSCCNGNGNGNGHSHSHSHSRSDSDSDTNKSSEDDINANNAPSSSLSSTTIQHQLDTIHTRWALEDTAIPSLAESIHRLQSALSLLQAEADAATAEIHALQTALTESKSRERRLERAIRKLFAENERLRDRLAKRRQKSKAFVKNVKDAVGNMKVPVLKRRDSESAPNNDDGVVVVDGAEISKDATTAVVNQIKRHESALKESKRGSSDASMEPLSPQPSHQNTRQRTLTDSSLFSDIDESIIDSPFRSYNYDFHFDSGTCDASTDDTDEEQHDDEEGSVTSTSSAPLVTEKSTPTVSLRATNSFPPNLPKIDSSSLLGDEEDMIERNVYTLRFPVGRTVGIELQRVPLERGEAEVTTDAIPLSDDSTHSYTFADAAADVSSDIKAFGSLIGSVGKSALLGLAADEVSEVLGGTDESHHPNSAFLICGFAGFDSILNKRPPFGSRLVSIDDVSLERGSWTFSSLKKCIKAKSSIESGATTFTMTFRADPLSVKQKSILDKAVKFAQKKAEEENSANSIDHDESKDSHADEFLLVPSQPKLDGPLKTSSSHHSLRSSIGRQRKAETKKSAEAPGPEEVKMAVKAFSKKLKSIM